MKDMKPSKGAYQKLNADKRKRQLTYDLNFRGTVNPRNLFNEMFLETIPRKLSAIRYAVRLILTQSGHFYNVMY